MMCDALSNFRNAIRAAGLEPPDVIDPGAMHRFPGNGKRPSNRAGWCFLFYDKQGGVFGDWSTGLSETWQAKRDKPYSKAEQAAFARRVKNSKRHAKTERRNRWGQGGESSCYDLERSHTRSLQSHLPDPQTHPTARCKAV